MATDALNVNNLNLSDGLKAGHKIPMRDGWHIDSVTNEKMTQVSLLLTSLLFMYTNTH